MNQPKEPWLVHGLTDWKIEVTRIWHHAEFEVDNDLKLVTACEGESYYGTFNLAADIGRIER